MSSPNSPFEISVSVDALPDYGPTIDEWLDVDGEFVANLPPRFRVPQCRMSPAARPLGTPVQRLECQDEQTADCTYVW